MSNADTPTCTQCGQSHGSSKSCPNPLDPRINTVVDKYRVVRLLGRGGMGSVYEAHHVSLQRRFAIKFMLPEYAGNRDTLRRFENEARAAGRLEHANIAAVTDVGRATDAAPYLVMEFLAGQDCSKLLASSGRLPIERAANLVFQACLGLSVAHQAGIVHRDVKPENLFVTDAGDGSDLVKVLDFGIAKLRTPNASAVTGSGTAMGTFYYMAPEQVRDSGKVDERADVWALGVVLYELLTAKKPFEGTDATQIMYQVVFGKPEALATLRPEVAPGLVAAVEKALCKDPDARFASVKALADAIAPYTGRASVRPHLAASEGNSTRASAQPTYPPYRATTSHASIATLSTIAAAEPRTMAKRKSTLITVAVVLVIAAAGIVIWFSLRAPGPAQPSANASSPIGQTHVAAAAVAAAVPEPMQPVSVVSAVAPLGAPAATPSLANSLPDIRTSSEHERPTSNALPRAGGKNAPVNAKSSTPPEREADAKPPSGRVPEKPNTSNRAPISIDTSSPF